MVKNGDLESFAIKYKKIFSGAQIGPAAPSNVFFLISLQLLFLSQKAGVSHLVRSRIMQILSIYVIGGGKWAIGPSKSPPTSPITPYRRQIGILHLVWTVLGRFSNLHAWRTRAGENMIGGSNASLS